MMNNMKKLSLVTFLPIMLLLTACGTQSPALPSATATAAPSETVSAAPQPPSDAPTPIQAPATSGTIAEVLESLTVAPETNTNTYNRDTFNHWVSKNNTNCDTRFAVLEAESLTPITSKSCSITSGSWYSAYDGVEVTDASKLDIDHMVPLAEAWRSGAYAWDDATREAYANDLGYDKSLVAVTASSNRSKSDSDPANWMPDTDACVYVTDWVLVKHRWNLAVDDAEKNKILQVLSFCEETQVTAPEKATDKTVEGTPVEPTEPVTSTQPEAPPATNPQAGTDPKFSSCKEAKSNGYGPYIKDVDVEYSWYSDRDGDGTVCE